MKKTAFVTDNPWRRLRGFTHARIGIGRAGISIPTREMLEFQLAHAEARDAVHFLLDVDTLEKQLLAAALDAPLRLHSQAVDRMTYLQRPDSGRRLNTASRDILQAQFVAPEPPCDLAIVIVDGLSSLAVAQHTVPFLRAFHAQLIASACDWKLAPLTLVEQGRVAVGDEVGELLNASAVIVLVGERPGLSSPDSLGLYLTWGPQCGLKDAMRNCISNIRPAGLKPQDAARKACYLLSEARRLQLSGVNLKDHAEDDVLTPDSEDNQLFLLPTTGHR